MKVHETSDIKQFFCAHCYRITEHHHQFFIMDGTHTIPLRKCRDCGLEAGTEVLHFLSVSQKFDWRKTTGERPFNYNGAYDS